MVGAWKYSLGLLSVLVCVTIMIAGCGGGDGIAGTRVSGRVVMEAVLAQSRTDTDPSPTYVAVPNASITLQSVDNPELKFTTTSDDTGLFSIGSLPVGHYTLTIRKMNTSNLTYWAWTTVDLEHSVDLHDILITRNPVIHGISVTVNGTPYETNDMTRLQVDDIVSIAVQAEDPNDRPISYQFWLGKSSGGGTFDLVRNWSVDNVFTYTVTEEDDSQTVNFSVRISNTDGINDEQGDAQSSVSLIVAGNKQPPVITGVRVYYQGQLTDQRAFSVGDTVTIELEATDPNALPLEYKFVRMRNNCYNSTLQDWSADHRIIYTFEQEDAEHTFAITEFVRNNDGLNAQGEFKGDDQASVSFDIESAIKPATITKIDVLYNGVVTSQRVFHVGDTITLHVHASDPNNLPIEYAFTRMRASTFDSWLQDWSITSSLTYTFVAEDLVSSFSLCAAVRNNDGIDAIDDFGDFLSAVNISVTDF